MIYVKDQNFHWNHRIHKHGPEVDLIMFKACSHEAIAKYKISYQGCFWKLVSHRCLRCRWCMVPYAGPAFGSSSYPYRRAYAERRKPKRPEMYQKELMLEKRCILSQSLTVAYLLDVVPCLKLLQQKHGLLSLLVSFNFIINNKWDLRNLLNAVTWNICHLF